MEEGTGYGWRRKQEEDEERNMIRMEEVTG